MPTPPAVLLLLAAQPRHAISMAIGLGTAAAVAGRPLREVGLVVATVLVGQAIIGWADDLTDRRRDERHRPGQAARPRASTRGRSGSR